MADGRLICNFRPKTEYRLYGSLEDAMITDRHIYLTKGTLPYGLAIQCYDLDSGELVNEVPTADYAGKDFCITSDEKRLLSASGNRASKSIDIIETSKERSFRMPEGYAPAVAFDTNGEKALFVKSLPNRNATRIELWDMKSLGLIRAFEECEGHVSQVDFINQDSQCLCICGNSKKANIYDVAAGSVVWAQWLGSGLKLSQRELEVCHPVRFAARRDGKLALIQMAAGYTASNGILHVLDLDSRRIIHTLHLNRQLNDMCFTKEDGFFITVEKPIIQSDREVTEDTAGGYVCVWETVTGNLVNEYLISKHNMGNYYEILGFVCENEIFLYSSYKNACRVINWRTGEITLSEQLYGYTKPPGKISFDKNTLFFSDTWSLAIFRPGADRSLIQFVKNVVVPMGGRLCVSDDIKLVQFMNGRVSVGVLENLLPSGTNAHAARG